MQLQTAEVQDALCHQPVQAAPSDMQIAALRRLMGRSQRPVVILGGTGWTSAACDNFKRFAEANYLPVACAFRYQDLFDNRHPNYIGDVGIGINPKLAQRIKDADLVIAVGARLGEMTTSGYTLLDAPLPAQSLVHVHASAEELGRVYQAQLMINAGMQQFASRLAMMMPIEEPPWRESVGPGEGRLRGVAAAAGGVRARRAAARPVGGGADPRARGARRRDHHERRRQLLRLGPPVLALHGDADATRAHRRFDGLRRAGGDRREDRRAGALRRLLRRRRRLPDDRPGTRHRRSSTAPASCFSSSTTACTARSACTRSASSPAGTTARAWSIRTSPRLAEAYGAFGATADTTDGFAIALAQALAFMREKHLPAVVELRTDPEVITPNATLTAIRATARLAH